MSIEKGRPGTRIEEHDLTALGGGDRHVHRPRARRRHLHRDIGSGAIDAFHLGEIKRGFRLPGENGGGEVAGTSLQGEAQGRVEPPLVSQRRAWHRPKRLATGAARAVRGQDLQKIRKIVQSTEARIKFVRPLLLGAADARGRLQQIRPTGVADEEKIAAQQGDGFGCPAAFVRHEKANVLGRVPGSVPDIETDSSDIKMIPIAQERDVLAAARPLGLPVPATFGRQVSMRPVIFHQRPRTADEVRVNVRLGDRHDFQVVLRGDPLIAFHVAFGIDDDGIPATLATNHVRVLGKPGIKDLSEKHGRGAAASFHRSNSAD